LIFKIQKRGENGRREDIFSFALCFHPFRSLLLMPTCVGQAIFDGHKAKARDKAHLGLRKSFQATCPSRAYTASAAATTPHSLPPIGAWWKTSVETTGA